MLKENQIVQSMSSQTLAFYKVDVTDGYLYPFLQYEEQFAFIIE